MADIQTYNMSSQLKTNLIWIITVNIALVVLYLTVSHRIHSSNIDIFVQNSKHFNQQTINQTIWSGKSTNNIKMYPQKVVSSDCNGLLFPAHLSTEVTWRPVNKQQSAYVFSVYHLKEKSKLVIIGAKVKDYTSYYCQLWYRLPNNAIKMAQKSARAFAVPEGHGKRYTASMFECILKVPTLPDFVSLVSEDCAIPLNILTVHKQAKKSVPKRLFTVCLTPLNFHYGRDSQLIEWIELNRILGAEKFIVYNFSSTASVKRVLDFYSERGLTEVVQWKLPMTVDKYPGQNSSDELHYFGQSASLNDCLYRNKQFSEFIVNIDLDEFIIPHSGNILTWLDMQKQIFKLNRHTYSAYLFRNVFFQLELNTTYRSKLNSSFIEKFKLITLQKLEHAKYMYPARIRSKYFARTSRVYMLLIHDVHMLPYNQFLVVPPHIGFLHHYRNCTDLNLHLHENKLDKTVINKYGDTLINNVLNVWNELQEY